MLSRTFVCECDANICVFQVLGMVCLQCTLQAIFLASVTAKISKCFKHMAISLRLKTAKIIKVKFKCKTYKFNLNCINKKHLFFTHLDTITHKISNLPLQNKKN